MGGDTKFWYLFGGIWLLVGAAFLATSIGVGVFADPASRNQDVPLWVFAIVGGLAAVGGGSVIYVARAAAARDRALMETGIGLVATVVDIQRSMLEINRQPRWQVVYRYEYAKGVPLTGKSRALSSADVFGFKPGDKVSIKVDPTRPEQSVFVGAA